MTNIKEVLDLIQKVEEESCALVKDQKKIILKQMEASIQSYIDDIPSIIQNDFDEWKRGDRICPFQAPTAFEFPDQMWSSISKDDKQPVFEKFKKSGFIIEEGYTIYHKNVLEIIIDDGTEE